MAATTASRARSSSSSNNSVVPLVPTSGRELLLDLKRSTARNALGSGGRATATLPAYNHKLVQACFRDLHGTAQELELKARAYSGGGGNSKPSMSARPSILLHNQAIQRHKRCLLAYHHHRMEIIKDIQRTHRVASQGGGEDDDARGASAVSTHAGEAAFARDYASLREAYSASVFELDLLPPASHSVQVRVEKETGQVVLPDSGRIVSLTRGARLYLDRADAGDFLRQGIVRLCDGEEVDF